jgi:hypothetical protein
VLPGGGWSDDGKNSEPRMAGVGHMAQGWWRKGVETFVQYVSRLGPALVEGKFIGSKIKSVTRKPPCRKRRW